MGLNSGEVIVGKIGDDLRMDYTAQGHTVGLAQRMEQLAEPGVPYLTAHTARLVEGYVKLRSLGEFSIKGAKEALAVYALEGLGPLRTRFEVSRARGLSKFVGREAEMQPARSGAGARDTRPRRGDRRRRGGGHRQESAVLRVCGAMPGAGHSCA